MEKWREKFRNWGKLRKKEQLLTILLVTAILLLAFWPEKTKETPTEEDTESLLAETEETEITQEREALEGKLKNILEQVEGVGLVEVAITLESTGTKTVEKDVPDSETSTKKSQEGTTEESESKTSQEATVYTEGADGSKTPYVVRETMPEVRGVLVIAQGGDDPEIVQEIKEAVMALFHLEAHKIKVMKKK